MSTSRTKRFTPASLRADCKDRGETRKQSGPLFMRVVRILDRLRCSDWQRVQPTETPNTATPPERRSVQSGGPSSVGTTLPIVFQSLQEAFAAHRRYEELTSKGIPHDTAIRQALGIPRVPP